MPRTIIGIDKANFESITMNSLVGRHKGEWVRLSWSDQTGRVWINSSYGDWSYCWNSIGNRTLAQFLASLDWHYMGKKMLGAAIDVPDDQETAKYVMKEICRMRREGEIEVDQARLEYDHAKDLLSGDICGHDWVRDSSLCEPWQYCQTVTNSDWKYFWERLWVPVIQPALKELPSA